MCRICARPTEIFPDGGSPPSYLKPIFYSALMKVIHSLRVTFSKNA